MHEHQADQADNAKSKQELLIEEYNIPLTLASADNFRGFFRKVRNLVGDLGIDTSLLRSPYPKGIAKIGREEHTF